MNPATAHVGDIVTVQRNRKQYGAGRDKLVYSYVEATQLPRRGVIERSFRRFAVVGMLANRKGAEEDKRPLYRECFYWQDITSKRQENA